MTTKEAFKALVDSPYLWRKTGQTKNARRVHKYRAARDQWPSTDAMEQLVGTAFDVQQEKAWRLK